MALVGHDRGRITPIVLLFIVASLVEMIGIGMVAPFVAVIVDPELLGERWMQIGEASGISMEYSTLVYILGGGLVMLFVLKTGVTLFTQYVILGYSNSLQVRLRRQLLESHELTPYSAFTERNSAEHTETVLGLTEKFSKTVVYGLLKSVSDITIAVTILLFLAWTNLLAMSLLVAMLLFVVLGWDYLVKKRLERMGYEETEATIQITRGVIEIINGLKELRILGLESFFRERIVELSEQEAAVQRKSAILQLTPNNLLELSMVLYVVLLVSITLFLDRNVVALLPTFAVFGVAAIRLLPTARNFSFMLGQIRASVATVDRLYEHSVTLKSLPNLEPDTSNDSQPDEFDSLVVKGVHFQYPNSGIEILRGASLEVHKGEAIGLVGASGVGKTTFVNVLLGLLSPNAGEILYNDRAVDHCMALWRKQVAYLPQEAFLTDDSITNNIALGVSKSERSQDKIESAARQARLENFVSELPLGYETILGERGIKLSGGQRQRVVLARALYHNRQVLVLDEATSSLDLETEKEIVDEIKNLKGKVTLIVIAHRLTTLEHCDRIYRLEKGVLNQVDDLFTPKFRA